MNTNKNEEQIIRKYAKIQKLNSICIVSSIIILPFLVIAILLTEDNALLGFIFQRLLIVFVVCMLYFYYVIRRCPNCHRLFSRYVINPKNCPFCKVRLR